MWELGYALFNRRYIFVKKFCMPYGVSGEGILTGVYRVHKSPVGFLYIKGRHMFMLNDIEDRDYVWLTDKS